MSEHLTDRCETGNIVTLYGTPWRIMGWQNRHAALLERVGCEDMPVNQRTHHAVIIGSMHAQDFKTSLQQSHNDGIATEGSSDHFVDATDMVAPDHSGLAQTVELDEATVISCMEVARRFEDEWHAAWRAGHKSDSHLEGKSDGASEIVAAIGELVPVVRSRAEVLVEAYRQTFINPDIVATHMDDEMAFARWLETEGKLA